MRILWLFFSLYVLNSACAYRHQQDVRELKLAHTGYNRFGEVRRCYVQEAGVQCSKKDPGAEEFRKDCLELKGAVTFCDCSSYLCSLDVKEMKGKAKE